MVAVGPLSPSAVLRAMAEALSTHQHGDTTSDLSSSHEALALFVHACMTSLGFRLLGFDEDKPDEAQCHSIAPRLPANWNASFNTYAFVYTHHDSSSSRFVIKVDRLGGKAEIRGIAHGSDTIARAEVLIKDYISNAALPLRITLNDEGLEERADLPQKLRNILVSNDQIIALANLVHVQIVQELLPSSQPGDAQPAEDQEESPDDRAAREDAEDTSRRGPRNPQPEIPDLTPKPANPYPFRDPLDPPPRAPVPAGDFPPPDFEDPYDINRPRGGGPLHTGGRTPFGGVGADDLNPPPLGPGLHDPLRPGGGGGWGGLPGGGHRGMHPTFGDPMFGGLGPDRPDFDPQAPPGARFDPVGPFGGPPSGRMGGRRGGGPGGFGGGGGGFGGGDFI
ncbi:PI31 proteasome regulator N-terminal-domain-containing protein [Microdochium trichocladiopsis]|uniref:PI31 proteasome regulator N-terminal-domain-containing protein n=1 Tax=Microdochium trichocladiopsis TaxID=1682393 RepID=A0A9P8YEX7_9PEZI|nr:PI31 proteasome regulator N-terminal-domain-containing protein [Microdochium trichocladiopsis]KAH7035748.1 PI31 proteasome regulator N-terminal-domain-containing protein [Microdochium trichocladiopsis]